MEEYIINTHAESIRSKFSSLSVDNEIQSLLMIIVFYALYTSSLLQMY